MSERPENFEHWQAKLGAAGDVAIGFDDIHQGMRLVIETPLGSIPGLPEFGCNHDLFKDLEQEGAAIEASFHLTDILANWCERVLIEWVEVTHIEASRAQIKITYYLPARVRGDLQSFVFESNFGVRDAEL